MRIFIGLLLITSLTGCEVMTVENNPKYNQKEKNIANSLAYIAARKCVTTKTMEVPGATTTTGKIKSKNNVNILALYSSDTEWYKADAQIYGIYDSLYYLPSRSYIVCGAKNWGEYKDSRKIAFKSLVSNNKKILPTASSD